MVVCGMIFANSDGLWLSAWMEVGRWYLDVLD